MELEQLNSDDRYCVKGWRGVAFYFAGAQTEPDVDTEWSGIENETGLALMVMVGDDHQHVEDPGDIEIIADEDYCSVCGQIGCAHDGR